MHLHTARRARSDPAAAAPAGAAPVERGVVSFGGGRTLAFEVAAPGAGGTPVLLLGPLGGSMALWGGFRDALAARARVITFDRAGAGGSSAAPAFQGTRGMARDAARVLDRLGVARAHVFGVSLGGMVATWLAIDAPARVARLCLASTPAAGIDLSWSGVGRALSLAACLARPSAAVQPCLVRRVLSRRLRERDPERAARLADLASGLPARRLDLVKHAAAAVRHDARRHLHRIRAPTLVLAGDHDELLDRRAQQALAAAIPGARFEIVPEAGHAVVMEQPAFVATRVSTLFLG